MSAIAEAPAATMGSSMPSSSGEINASTMMRTSSSQTPATPAATPVAKPAAAMRPPAMGEPAKVIDDGKKPSESLFANLRKLADRDPNAPAAKKGEAKKDDTAVAEGDEDLGEGEVNARAPDDKSKTAAKPGEKLEAPLDKKKVNPWKVIDEHKAARAKLEAEVAELRKSVANPEARKAEVERLSAIEKRNQELEEQIKFVDYSKSKEFTDKYQKPYEAAWSRAMGELKELSVVDPETGDERPMAPADLLDLVNMPLMKARERADELYGASSNEVMAYRKEIRGLYEQQSQALEQAKKAGVEKATKESQEREILMKSLQEDVTKQWEQVNKEYSEHETNGKYLKPVEGNDEINTRLEKGFKFVDETSKINVWDPNLTPEQRKDAIKRHAAVRARAAAFGRVRYELESVQKELSDARAKLAEYEKSTPTFGGDSREASATANSGGHMSGLMQRLQKRAV